jgi:hypothetical protein
MRRPSVSRVRGAACNGIDHAGESPAAAIARFGCVAVPDVWAGRPSWPKAQAKALRAERSDPSGGQANSGAAAESEHCSVEMASHVKRVVGYRAAEPDSRMGEGQWTLPKQRARAGSVCSGAWVVAPAEWSVTQSREGLKAVRPEVQASNGEAEGGPETGGSGRSSDDARDNITLAEQRTRGTAACAGWARTRPDMPMWANGNQRSSSRRRTQGASNSSLARQGATRWNVRSRCLEAVLGKTRRTEFQRGTMKRSHGAC